MPARAGFWERAYVVVTLFLLAYSLPQLWLRRSDARGETLASGGTLDSLVFTGLLGLSIAILAASGPGLARVLSLDRAVLALIGLLVISSQWSYDPGSSLRRSIALALTTAFAYYLVQRFPLDDIVALAGAALAIGAVLNFAWILGLPQFGTSAAGWTGLLSHKNPLGRMAALGALTHLLLIRLRPRARSWHLGLTVLNVVLVAGSLSTTAAVTTASLGALLLVYLTFRARRTLFGAVLVALATTVTVGALVATDQLEAITDALGKDITLTGRTVLWAGSLEAVSERPLFGYGYDGFWGGWWSPSHEVWRITGWTPPHSHNAVIEMLLAAGIVGAVLLVFITGRAVLRAITYLRSVPGALGLWPLSYLSYVVLVSITERGIVTRSIFWVLFVVAVLVVAQRRHDLAGGDLVEGSQPPVGVEQGVHAVLPSQLVP